MKERSNTEAELKKHFFMKKSFKIESSVVITFFC